MNRHVTEDGDRQEQLNELILEYVDALQAGQNIDRCQFLAAHPDLRPELEAFFAGHDEVERVAAPLRTATGEGSKGGALARNWDPSGGRLLGVEPRGNPSDLTPALGQLGEFRLLREIGRGGMGVVYEAEQLSLQRRVALKVLPFAAALDPRQLQRFKNEALAAANLRHENIVPVHGVGCELGVHYYAMQIIEGQSLAAVIRELRHNDEGRRTNDESMTKDQGPSPKDPPPGATALTQVRHSTLGLLSSLGIRHSSFFRTVAQLGIQAALALEYAHQTGIIHRDIKPANLLLDPRGQLWITDFGLAQIAGDAGLTVTGELLGTLRYASPEQTRGRRVLVDHRTDIYSLGATLYELLTLRPIFEGRDRNELLRQIADEEPPSPRAVHPPIPAELETIVLKALAKEPSERYATARELADDLQRFLDDRPILARRPTLGERLRKWARRRPSVVIASTTVLILLSAGSLLSTALIHGEQRKAQEAYQRERLRADEAEAQFRLARRSVDELFQVSEEELAGRPGTEALRKRLLTSVLYYYQEFIAQRQDDPGAQAHLLETTKGVEKILADLAMLRAAGQLNLLSQPAVLDDLRLNEGQRAKVKDLSARVTKQWNESHSDIGRRSGAERRRRSLEQARANEADVKAILTPEQLRRLHQIGLQSDALGAFREPEVATVLQLTAEQRERIRTIEEEAFLGMLRTFWPDLPSGDSDKIPEPKKPPHERIVEVLTEEQARKWREMIGAPFKGSIAFPPPFGPGGPPPLPKGPMR